MKLFLVRHGQTTANLAQIYAGQSDVKLTELGRQQARDIAPILAPFHFDKVYSSDLSRAVETQQLALPGVVGEQTPLLREYDVGTLVGRTFEEVRQMNDAQLPRIGRTRDYSIYGGENNPMVSARLRKFLATLEEDSCDNVIAFAHNGILGAMLGIVLDADYDRSAASSGNCAIHVFEFNGTRWRLLAWNYMAKL